MFLVLIHYTKPLEEVLRLRPRHRDFLHEHYRAGRLVVSGPRNDGKGGVVVVRKGLSRDEVVALFALDPYAVEGVATHEVLEFEALSYAPGFEAFVKPPA